MNSDNSLYSMRKRPSQARSKATIDVILIAAARVLIESGYAKASTNKIANLAGVSVGSLYEYFPGKEAIYAEVQRREDQRLYDLSMALPQPESIKDLIRQHISVYLNFVRSNLKLHAALLNDVPQFAFDRNKVSLYSEYRPQVMGVHS